jgi:ubiquinone/menaquinone biosynthesis C-methylase UbiE
VKTPAAYRPIAPAGGDTATPLNLAKRLRVIERYAALRGKRVLDCGCGAGEYVSSMRAQGATSWGIEFSKEKVATSHESVSGRLSVGDLQSIAIRSDSIDVALLNEVLEHVPDESRALREVHRVLRPGGTLLVFSPNRRYPFETHGARFRWSGRRMPHYLPLVPYVPLRLSQLAIEFWARNYWPGELRRVVHQAGFTVTHTDYVWQTFEGISSHQPRVIGRVSPVLRRVANLLERLPLLRTLGVSQVIVATKAAATAR